jgi:CelD/BcsL family acetyltransferase involved in cellulose biosynthesis
LHCSTRKRHGLPPQPFFFFENVFKHVILKDYGQIISAIYSGKAVAASIFFHFGPNAIYKYGASDAAHHDLRPNNLLMWEAIRWYRDRGFETLNLGRTEVENYGLLRYKRAWGAAESSFSYYRFDFNKSAFVRNRSRSADFYSRFCPLVPTSISRIIGTLFYKHAG